MRKPVFFDLERFKTDIFFALFYFFCLFCFFDNQLKLSKMGWRKSIYEHQNLQKILLDLWNH